MHPGVTTPPLIRTTRPKLLFVIVEDWFFVSHFISFARAAIAGGFDVAVATRIGQRGPDALAAIAATGARILPLTGNRGALGPASVLGEVGQLVRIMRDETPDIVHLFGLRPILTGSLAARLAGTRRRVVALTGTGLIGAGETAKAKFARAGLRRILRPLTDGRNTRYVFENRADPALLGLSPDDAGKVVILGGAGVDPAQYPQVPMPPLPPLRLAMIARMLWSKGVDTAVEAVTIARSKGVDITLSLYGEPDPENPRALSEATLRDWAARPGVVWLGRTGDVAGVWAAHHAAIQPSRGGEGLPRTLLEAASCGRPILTTDVPGCRDFVRDGQEGYVVPPGDAMALAECITGLAADPERLEALGKAARARVLNGHTEADVTATMLALYRDMLG